MNVEIQQRDSGFLCPTTPVQSTPAHKLVRYSSSPSSCTLQLQDSTSKQHNFGVCSGYELNSFFRGYPDVRIGNHFLSQISRERVLHPRFYLPARGRCLVRVLFLRYINIKSSLLGFTDVESSISNIRIPGQSLCSLTSHYSHTYAS